VSGTVYLVGAGPGAADLLTLRAARLLAEADIVFHDALVPQAILSLASRAEKVAVGKRCGRHSTAQQFINKRLADAARHHRVVVRLKGGDPMLFGRAQEEIRFLRLRGIDVGLSLVECDLGTQLQVALAGIAGGDALPGFFAFDLQIAQGVKVPRGAEGTQKAVDLPGTGTEATAQIAPLFQTALLGEYRPGTTGGTVPTPPGLGGTEWGELHRHVFEAG